jgi:hypothetical protein
MEPLSRQPIHKINRHLDALLSEKAQVLIQAGKPDGPVNTLQDQGIQALDSCFHLVKACRRQKSDLIIGEQVCLNFCEELDFPAMVDLSEDLQNWELWLALNTDR